MLDDLHDEFLNYSQNRHLYSQKEKKQILQYFRDKFNNIRSGMVNIIDHINKE